MITAQEARELKGNAFVKNKAIIEKLVMEAIELERQSVTLDYTLGASMKTWLIDLGYKVEYGSQKNEQFTSISW